MSWGSSTPKPLDSQRPEKYKRAIFLWTLGGAELQSNCVKRRFPGAERTSAPALIVRNNHLQGFIELMDNSMRSTVQELLRADDDVLGQQRILETLKKMSNDSL